MNTFTTSPHSSGHSSGQAGRGSEAVTVRAVTPDDAHAIHALYARLHPESIYSRFLQYRIPTLREIAAVCAMEPAQGAGVVAETRSGRRQIVGLAYYVREGDRMAASAELAIVVEDRYQGAGIGRLLWQQLHRQAEADRLSVLRVLFSSRNRRILRLIEGSGYAYECCNALFGGGDLNEYHVAIPSPCAPRRMRKLLDKVVARVF